MKARIFLLIILATAFCFPAWAAPPSLKLEPATVNAKVGDTFALTVIAVDVMDLFGASFELTFDDGVLDAQDVKPGDFLGQNVVFFDQIVPGRVSVAITKRAGDPAVAGSGALAEVTFTVKAEGETEVAFVRDTLELNRDDGSRIPQFDKLTLGKTLVGKTPEPPERPHLKFELATASVTVGESLTLTVVVEDVINLFGASFDIAFDETFWESPNVEPGDFLGVGADIISFPQVSRGKISMAITKKAGGTPVAGNGELAKITFTAKAEGDTEISFIPDTLALQKADGSPIDGFGNLTLGTARINIHGPTETHLKFESSTTTINAGEPLVLAIVVEKVNELFGVSLEIQFDNTLLEYQKAETSDFLGTDVVFFDQASPGKVSLAITKKAGAAPASGSGTLATMTFTAKAEGKAAITFIPDTLVLQKADGSRIPQPTLGTAEIIIEDNGIEVELFEGTNMISIPLDPGKPWRISHLAEAIIDDPTVKLPVSKERAEALPLKAIVWYNTDEKKFVSYLLDFALDKPANREVKVADGFIVVMTEDKTVRFNGTAWKNRPAAAPAIEPSTPDATPVLIVEGTVERARTNRWANGLNVTLRNQTTQQVADDVTGFWAGEGQYILLLVDLGNKRAARVGDELEILITSPSGELGGEILTHTVQPRDVNNYVVSIGSTSLTPKPKRSELLQNYPNPFNPETWIPFKLADDAEVTISLFTASGTLIRTLHLGHKVAGSYLSKEKAAYWDGHNVLGEKVSSGVYFYTIRAEDFTAVRKLLILK